MFEMEFPDATRRLPRPAGTAPPNPIVLWSVRGATDDLRGLVIETSFGYALGLELDTELVLLHLQPSLETLIAYADRIEAALLAQGWQRIEDRPPFIEGVRMTPIVSTPQDVSSLAPAAMDRSRRRRVRRQFATIALLTLALVPATLRAQSGSPWENAVSVLMTSFTGPIARGLSLVSIVVGGITFAFGEGGSKRLLAGIVFGVGMAIGAVNFMGWLFP